MRILPAFGAVVLAGALAPGPAAARATFSDVVAYVRVHGRACQSLGQAARCGCAPAKGGQPHRVVLLSADSVELVGQGFVFWSNQAGTLVASSPSSPKAAAAFAKERKALVSALETRKLGACR